MDFIWLYIAFIWLLFATFLAISTKPFTTKYITYYISRLYKYQNRIKVKT